MAPEVDQIYSYFLYLGDWKGISPEQIIEKKRQLDDLVYSNRIFFSDQFFDSYTAFHECLVLTLPRLAARPNAQYYSNT